jgi:hypothetical protein
LIEGVSRMNDPAPGTLREREGVRQIHNGSASHPHASEILNTPLRAVVFSALGVVPFHAEPGAS